MCPRCHGYCGLGRGDDPKLRNHKRPYGGRCPTEGLTWSEAKAGWTALSMTTYRWLLANKPDQAEQYRKDRIND